MVSTEACRATGSIFRQNIPQGVFWCLSALAGLLQLRTAHAEDSLTVKAQSWQEANNRIRVDSQYALAESDITPDAHLKVMGLIDSIAGATPTGELPTHPGYRDVHMQDMRKAWDTNLAYQFKRVNVAASFGNSRESDYVSNGYSLNTLTNFNEMKPSLAGRTAAIRPVTI